MFHLMFPATLDEKSEKIIKSDYDLLSTLNKAYAPCTCIGFI